MEFFNIFINDINYSKCLADLFNNDSFKYFPLDLYYRAFTTLNINYNENFGCTYFESCNKASQLVVMYIETIVRIFLNNFDMVCKFLIDYALDTLQLTTLFNANRIRTK